MKTLNELNVIGWDRTELEKALETNNGSDFQSEITKTINACSDIETLKKSAITFDGVREFYGIEDRLIELMGEDEYFDFADKNELA